MKKMLLTFAVVVFIAGCSKDNGTESSNKNEKLIDSVWEYAQNNPFGFTLNLETMESVKFGISVAYLETQDSFGKEGLERAIEHSQKNNKIVGGWLNTDNNLYYFDSVKLFKNSELEKAIEFAKQNKQTAIFDLTNLREIRIRQ